MEFEVHLIGQTIVVQAVSLPVLVYFQIGFKASRGTGALFTMALAHLDYFEHATFESKPPKMPVMLTH